MPAESLDPVDDLDARVLARLADVWSAVDPPPSDLVDRVVFDVAVAEVQREAALVLRQAGRHAGTGLRSGDEDTCTVTFTSRDRTIMVQISPSGRRRGRLDGWIDPPGPSRVRLRVGRVDREAPVSGTGRFHVDDLAGGTMRLTLLDDDGSPVAMTPAFEW